MQFIRLSAREAQKNIVRLQRLDSRTRKSFSRAPPVIFLLAPPPSSTCNQDYDVQCRGDSRPLDIHARVCRAGGGEIAE
jgi:hypothetical protein